MIVHLEIQHMADSELLQHVPADVMASIRDKHDAVEAYTIAHTGSSRTHVVGLGKAELKWYQQIIPYIKAKILPGIPVYHRHGDTNSHDGRSKIGEVINAIQMGTDKVVAIIRRYANSLGIPTDVASFEAPLRTNTTQLDGHAVQAHEIGDITAIALAHSSTSTPAFAGAIREAYLQCLTGDKMTLTDILTYIKDNKVTPTQIYSPDDLLKVDEIQTEIAARKGSSNQYYETLRLKAELQDAREKHAKELQDSKAAMDKVSTDLLQYQTKDIFGQAITMRKDLTEQQRKFIDMERDSLKVEPGKDLLPQVNGFLDNVLKKYDTQKSLFAPPATDPNVPNSSNLPGPGQANSSNTNPLIPG
jgi:hypothetical protein